MTYKATQVYVMMRETQKENDSPDIHPVAVFTDLETADGNTDGYNLSMQEQGVVGIRFYVAITAMYE